MATGEVAPYYVYCPQIRGVYIFDRIIKETGLFSTLNFDRAQKWLNKHIKECALGPHDIWRGFDPFEMNGM